MTQRSKTAGRARTRIDRPAPVALFQRSLTEWYAEYKAQKAAQTAPPDTRPTPN